MTAKFVLKKMSPIHCARGPTRCEKCKEYAQQTKIALLKVLTQDKGLQARPIIELEINGEKQFHPFDVIKYFDALEEAKNYAKEKDLTIYKTLLD